MHLQLKPSKFEGTVQIPSSKSHTLRAILFAFLANGTSQIDRFLSSPDTDAMLKAISLFGAKVKMEGDTLYITGVGGKPKAPEDVIHCGNSGLVLRLIGAMSALLPHYTILTGDDSIRHKRPALPLLSALRELGVFAESSRGDGYAPILIKGPILHSRATVYAQDSQPVSGLLIAAAFGPHPVEIHAIDPGEKPWIDLTLHWLKQCKIAFTMQDYTYYRVEGNAKVDAFHYTVPGDFSTAAFPIAAALITGSSITLENLDMDDVQGDKKVISILEEMGARFTIEKRRLHVHGGCSLEGASLDLNQCIDALPIFAVLGCFAKGKTEIKNCAIARHKESDRIHAMTKELRKMGASIEEKEDGMIISASSLQGAHLHSHEDHRVALSLAVAACAAATPSLLENIECIKKTYPHFIEDFQSMGGFLDLIRI